MELRDMMMENGVLPKILTICQMKFDPTYNLKQYGEPNDQLSPCPESQFVSLLQTVSWTLSNFCRYRGHKQEHLLLLLRCIYHLLQQDIAIDADDEDLSCREPIGGNIGWALTYLLAKIDGNGSIEILDIMNQSGITKSLIHLLASKNISTFHSSLRYLDISSKCHCFYNRLFDFKGNWEHLDCKRRLHRKMR